MISGDQTTCDGILAAIRGAVTARRQADLDELTAVLAWADLHTHQPEPRPGGDRLLQLGGHGTPKVSELCWAELAIARHAGLIATRNLAADALDLRHRLPLLFEQVQALRIEVWAARKIATMTRPLTHDAAALVDAAVDAAVAAGWQLPAGKLLALAEAKTIEADPEAHRRRITADQQRIGVWRSRPRVGDRLGGGAGTGEAATGRLAAQLLLPDLIEIDTFLDDLADKLATNQPAGTDQPTRDQLRAAPWASWPTPPPSSAPSTAPTHPSCPRSHAGRP